MPVFYSAPFTRRPALCIPTRPVDPHPGSEKAFNVARNWLETCLGSHTNCSKPNLNFMPTRVLKLEHSDDDDTFKLSLFHPKRPEYDSYAALSYCWGGDQPFKTTLNSISSTLKVDWQRLPKTIKDAIRVTSKLGMKYLWVDSLCIIQDKVDEVATEVSLMPTIYSQAALTILASRASSAKEGFLHDLGLESMTMAWNCFQIPFKSPGSSTGLMHITPTDPESFGLPEPLDLRVWALQEYFLSPRVLEYTSKQVRWTCYSANLVNSWSPYRSLYKNSISGIPERIPQAFPRNWDAVIYWWILVQSYTSRSLTCPTDRILAISGLADRMSSFISGGYAAGVWVDTLPESLL